MKLDIKGAISYYNAHQNPNERKMTVTLLALKVFERDNRLLTASKVIYLSKWANGTDLTKCNLLHIQTIINETGYSLTQLIRL